MITKAIILIPPQTESLIHTQRMSPLTYVGGLPVITRILYNAQWAGISEGIVLSWKGWEEVGKKISTDPKNVSFTWAAHPYAASDTEEKDKLLEVVSSPFILLSSQWLLDRTVLKELCAKGDEQGQQVTIDYKDYYPADVAPPAAVLQSGNQTDADIVHLLKSGGDYTDLVRRLRGRLSIASQVTTYGPPSLIKVHTKDDRQLAEQHLMKGLIKSTESFMSRAIERKISLAITKRLIYTRVRPNQISIFSILIGLASAMFFLAESWVAHAAGALLLLASSILDGCDGEVARLRYEESKAGSWIDFLGDNLVHMVVFLSIGLGLYNHGHGLVYLVLGIIAAAGTLASASMVFIRVFLMSKGGVISFATPVRLEEMEQVAEAMRKRIEFADKISNRDFIWIILVASVTGYLWVWAWLCGLGVLFYFFYLLGLYLKMRSVPSTSHGAYA